MVEHDALIEQRIDHFRQSYEAKFASLIEALNNAGISHYSSGCGGKRITFDLFPAATYVEDFTDMFALNRTHKAKGEGNYHDARQSDLYNPAKDFIDHMNRWLYFAEEVIGTNSSPRAKHAASAKKLMNELILAFTAIPRMSAKSKLPEVFELLRDIGLALQVRQKPAAQRTKMPAPTPMTESKGFQFSHAKFKSAFTASSVPA